MLGSDCGGEDSANRGGQPLHSFSTGKATFAGYSSSERKTSAALRQGARGLARLDAGRDEESLVLNLANGARCQVLEAHEVGLTSERE